MAEFYLGKFNLSDDDFQNKTYTGSLKTSYLDKNHQGKKVEIKEGDYVFPVHRANISKLWRVTEVKKDNDESNNNDPKGTIQFESIVSLKEDKKIKLQDFVKCSYFELDEILIYRQKQNTFKEKFFQLTLTKETIKKPKKDGNNNKFDEEKIKEHFKNISKKNNFRKIYIADKDDNNGYKEGDIKVEVENVKKNGEKEEKGIYKITQFQEYKNSKFGKYEPLQKLFNRRTGTKGDILKTLNQRFYKEYEIKGADVTLDGILKLAQLNIEYRKETNAKQSSSLEEKKKYINIVLKKISNSRFEIDDVRGLYDYIIAGVGHLKFPPIRDEKIYSNYINLLDTNLNLVLYGPPGTGKTYTARQIVIEKELRIMNKQEKDNDNIFNKLIKNGRVEFITFHQSFSYEEFVEGIRPTLKKPNSTYEISNGVLKRISNKARKAWKAWKAWKAKEDLEKTKKAKKDLEKAEKKLNHYLIIDELNAGDPARVFGELFTLIEKDKRGEFYKVTLPYSGERFNIPDNLYIIATMNTADRTSTVLDTALRRRFFFYELEPDSERINGNDGAGNIEQYNEKDPDNVSKFTVNLREILDTLNKSITKEIDRDHRIGHAYFMEIDTVKEAVKDSKDIKEKDLEAVWYQQIIPLLMDYFYNDNDKIEEIIGKKFVPNDNGKIKRLEGDEFIEALKEKFESAITGKKKSQAKKEKNKNTSKKT
ncbi:5-methylcytosine-specific restriction enzyme B [Spirochaetota bacterium]|nr:5-methylcytosine-specific restriction enzyme B [Spirochaetota bacterium]